MAYVLGFFAADGSMLRNKRGAHFIKFWSTDKELVDNIKHFVGAEHKISVRKRGNGWKTAYRLQLGSKDMFKDLISRGMTPAKSKKIKLPKVPNRYLPHFVRGYFDGDGCVHFGKYWRRNRDKWK